MGIESDLLNMRTRESFDCRGFSRFSEADMQAALVSKESLAQLLQACVRRPIRAESEDWHRWLTDTVWDFTHRGGAEPSDIRLYHDCDYGGPYYIPRPDFTRVPGIYSYVPPDRNDVAP
jgi:hypothetical protein